MDFSNWMHKISNLTEILPNIELPKYDLFNEINNSANTAKEKYGDYLVPLSNLENHELYFHLIKNACDNKKMIIRNPMYLHYNQPEILSSDICFITHFRSDNDYDFVFNYYFEENNIVLGLFSGSGMLGLGITVAYMIYYNEGGMLIFSGTTLCDTVLLNSKYFLPKIYDVIKNYLDKNSIEKINNEPSLIRTFEGYNTSLFHSCCTFVNGIYIIDQIGIKNEIDELIIGPNDPFLIEEYYKNKYTNINIIKGQQFIDWDSKIYKGIIFKYSHYHVINKCAEFIKTYITKALPISNIYQDEINYIKTNYYPIFSINLRCITCQIKDQDIIISEVINKLKNIYPNSFFLIGGFLGDYNEELINKQSITMGPCTNGYSHILNEYQNTVKSIKNKVNHTDLKSIIDLKINNILEFTKLVNFSINMNAGYTSIETILNNINSVYFGTKWNDHNQRCFYVSKENYIEPIYIYEPNIKFFSVCPNNSDYCLQVTCEISSDTIVDIVIKYDNEKNNIFKNNDEIKNEKNNLIYIAHRGNLNGPNPTDENKPEYLLEAISKGFCVETDLWLVNNILYLGHDEPQYEININFLLDIKDNLYCHCKNIQTLRFVINNYPEIECFYHDIENCVLTSKQNIWTAPGKELTSKSICVMPERVCQLPINCFGVCTDYPIKYKFSNTNT